MKWLWGLLGRRREFIHASWNANLCKHHDQTKMPDLLAVEYCKSCDKHICYICSHSHIDDSCRVEWESPLSHTKDDLIHSLNKGCRVKLNWRKLRCICGKPWLEGKDPTICLACLTATCSAECHLQLQETHQCLFFTNFTPNDHVYEKINGFRAMLYQNIGLAPDKGRVTFGSPRFASVYKEGEDHLIIQRGYRQYGQPMTNTTSCMEVIEDNPDYEHRNCLCECEQCVKSPHPVNNCDHFCLVKHEERNMQNIECWCLCSYCILVGAHSKMDCMHTCLSNTLK